MRYLLLVVFVNTATTNTVIKIKCNSLASKCKHLALVNMRQYFHAFRDAVCVGMSV